MCRNVYFPAFGCPYWYTGMKLPMDMSLTSKSSKDICSVLTKSLLLYFENIVRDN